MVILSDRSKSKKLSFKCSIELQAFRISFRKYRASLSLLFGLRCNPFCGRCCLLMLSFSMHSNCKAKSVYYEYVSLSLLFQHHVASLVSTIPFCNLEVVSTKERISKRVFQENQASQIFRKTNISYPLIRAHACAYRGVRNVDFSENLAYFVFLKHSF